MGEDNQTDPIVQAVDSAAERETRTNAREEELEFLRNLRANLVANLAKVKGTRKTL